MITKRDYVGKTLQDLRESLPAYGLRVRALFRGGHELPLLPNTKLQWHDVVRVIGVPEAIKRLTGALGQAVRPTNATEIVTLGFGIATGYLVGLITVPVHGIPVGLGTMGGIVVAGMVVATLRSMNPALGGPMHSRLRVSGAVCAEHGRVPDLRLPRDAPVVACCHPERGEGSSGSRQSALSGR